MGNETENQAKQLNNLADKKMNAKEYSEAIRLYAESVKLMNEVGNIKKADEFQKELDEAVSKRAQEMNSEGDALFKKRQYKDAIGVYKSALDLLQQAGQRWIVKYTKEFQGELNKTKLRYVKDELQPLAESRVKEKAWDQAMEIYKQILQIMNKEVDERANRDLEHAQKTVYERWAMEVNSQGDKLYKANDFQGAIAKYTEAVKLIDNSDNEKLQKDFKKELSKAFSQHAQEINTLGDRLMKEKNYLKASELYAQSVKIATEAGDKKLIDNFTNEMHKSYEKFAEQINQNGDALFKQKKFAEAAKIYENSVDIARESNNGKLIANFQNEFEKATEKWAAEVNNQGDQAMREKQFDKASDFYKQSVDVITKSGNKGLIKNYTSEYHNACLKLAKEINSQGDQLYNNKQYDQAFELYDKSVKLAEIAGDQGKIKDFSKERNKALEKMGS